VSSARLMTSVSGETVGFAMRRSGNER